MATQATQVKKLIFKAAMTVFILWLLLHNVDLVKLYDSYKQVKIQILFLSLVLIAAGNLIIPAMISMRSLKAGSLAFSLWDLVRVNFAVRFYSLFLPRGLVTGIRWVKYKNKGKGSDAAVLILFEKIVQVIIMVFFCVAFLGLDYKKLGPDGAILFFISVVCLLAGIASLCLFCSRGYINKFDRIAGRLTEHLPAWISSKYDSLLASLKGFNALTIHDMGFIILLSFIGHIFCIVGGYVLAKNFCPQISLAAFAWIRSVILFLSLMPLTIGNLGVREGGYMYLMGLYQAPAESALAFSFSLFTVQILTGLLGGLIEGFYYLFAKQKTSVRLGNRD